MDAIHDHSIMLKGSLCKVIDIEDPLLRAILGVDPSQAFDGDIYPITDSGCNNTFSRTYFTFLLRHHFGIERFPGFCEPIASCTDSIDAQRIAAITPSDIKGHLSELSTLYNHTQDQLRSVFKSPTLRLYRGLQGYTAKLAIMAVERSVAAGRKTAPIIANTYDCYTAWHHGYTDYECAVSLSVEVPIEDIVFCPFTIAGLGHIGKEFIVINRNHLGVIDLPLSCIAMSRFGKDPRYLDDFKPAPHHESISSWWKYAAQ